MPTTIRINPGMAIKPMRLSNLSSQLMSGGRVERERSASSPVARVDTPFPESSLAGVSAAADKTTPLYQEHVRLGARLIPFGGWLMPVQYKGIVQEHQAVRNDVGMFDISHMGQFIVDGPAAAAWLNRMLTNNVEK